ncbi:hypothetical protein [Oceanobacillus jeddahense]|uniref:hypothetical protein n=1 Tax=Oceanobacillus jeddahense TaxID=1462527 RepID=UPI0011DD3EEA|nr:hypothetical protein [Oceanobacillus jeddahense]
MVCIAYLRTIAKILCGAVIGFILLLAYHWLTEPAVALQDTVTTGIIAMVLISIAAVIYTFTKNRR